MYVQLAILTIYRRLIVMYTPIVHLFRHTLDVSKLKYLFITSVHAMKPKPDFMGLAGIHPAGYGLVSFVLHNISSLVFTCMLPKLWDHALRTSRSQ